MICPHCASNYTRMRGTRNENQRYACMTCKKWFQVPIKSDIAEDIYCSDITPGQVLSLKHKKPLNIHCATDVHHGAAEHHWSKFDDLIDEIDSDPDARWFLNGDNIELIPPNYKISQRGQMCEPDEQHITFIKRVKKIADKLLFVRGGNHDMIRSVNLLGVDICKVLADTLQVPYFKLPGYMNVNIGGKSTIIVSGHGKSGAGNGDLELTKMAAVFSDGDIFILGHNHQLYSKPVDSLRIDGDEERIKRRWYCRGGSFLRYAEYARYSFYPLVRTGWVTMRIEKDKIKCWTN